MTGLAIGRAVFARNAFGIVFDARVYRKPLISALLVWTVLIAAKDLVSSLPVAILFTVLCSVGFYFGVLRILGIPEEDRGLLTALRRG